MHIKLGIPYVILGRPLLNPTPLALEGYSLVFAKNTSASRYFAGVLAKYSAHGGILGKDG